MKFTYNPPTDKIYNSPVLIIYLTQLKLSLKNYKAAH